MTSFIRITNDDELDWHFEGVMIEVDEPFVGKFYKPGWKCRHCGWTVGATGYPPTHECPDGEASDDELVRRWRGEGCPTCERSLNEVGMLPTGCLNCGADRSSGSELWQEIERRGLINRVGPLKRR